MAEVFVNSGENSDNIVVPPPQLQGVFVPGIDNPFAVNGFGIVTPFGGGNTTRKYTDYSVSAEVSSQSTQLNDLTNAFVPGGVGGVGYNFEGLVGPQGIAGLNGIDGITQVVHLFAAPNSNYLTALPHNIDQINQLGTAADKLVYTDTLNTFGGSTEWTERRPAGAVDLDWQSVASDSDGSNLIACVENGRLYTSVDYGVNWTERQPAGNANKVWAAVASDADGSHLIAAIKDERVYTSSDYGVSWVERRPAGDANKTWSSVASDADGSNLIVCITNGRLYTSSNYGVNWTERQPDDADDNYWTTVASDNDGSVLIAGKGNTTVAALYISINSGVNWSEEIPASATTSWFGAASDADGSNLIAGGNTGRLAISDDSGSTWILKGAGGGDSWQCSSMNSDGSYIIAGSGTNLYESFDSGVTFAETQPAGATTKVWRTVSTSLNGSNTIVAVRGGRLYTGSISVGYSEATWAEADLTSAGRAILDDATAGDQRTTLGVGVGDSPVWAGATIGDVVLPTLWTDTQEPSGFLDKDATLSWDDGTRTLTITGSHDIYIFGVKLTKSTDSIQIADTTGLHWIYYNPSGVLTESTDFPTWSCPTVATVYWNTTGAFDSGLAGEERHGIIMDAATHALLHDTVGSRYESGLVGTFDDTTITIETGKWHDEDIEHNPSQQTTCNVLYKNGSAGFEWDAGVSVYYKLNGTALRYNNGNALADCTTNRYMAMWIFATNDISVPIVALMGQRQDVKIKDARANNTYESLELGTLPFQEMKLLYRVILRSTGSPPTYIETLDLRSVSNLPSGTYLATAHSTLTGLDVDDHEIYALLAGRTPTQEYIGSVDGSAGKVLVEDNATVAPTDESDGYIGVAVVAGEPRIYFQVEGNLYYVSNDGIAQAPVAGNPLGLLLSLTYA